MVENLINMVISMGSLTVTQVVLVSRTQRLVITSTYQPVFSNTTNTHPNIKLVDQLPRLLADMNTPVNMTKGE